MKKTLSVIFVLAMALALLVPVSAAGPGAPEAKTEAAGSANELPKGYEGSGSDSQGSPPPAYAGVAAMSAAAIAPTADIRAKLDLAFVIDTTGSMWDTIDGVKSNVASFAAQLAAKGIDLRMAVIEFRDARPTVDGLGSTIVHEFNGQVWQTGTANLIEILKRLDADGGGDTPETPIDALGYLPQSSMGWRSDARKFAFLFTDADFHTDNRHGYSSMAAVADALKAQNITTSVIGDTGYQALYRYLYESTGGVFVNIYGSYVDILMELAGKIEEQVLQVNYLRDVKFPAGKFWNHVGMSGNNQDGYTNSPCPTHKNEDGSGNVSTCNAFNIGGGNLSYQCMGFADKLQYDVYGSSIRGEAYRVYNLDSLKPGDNIRYNNNGHSIFVIAVNGDLITFADANGASMVGSKQNCQIWWEKTITKNQITGFSYVQSGPYRADQVYNIEGKRVRIACPVDVEVYNSYGELVARIVDNEVDYAIPVEIAIAARVVNGDEKEIILPRNISDYTIKILGTGNGTMDFSIADIDQATMSVSGTAKVFENIAIVPGKSFETTIPASTDAVATRVYVTVGGSPVAEVLTDGTEKGSAATYSVTFDLNGGIRTGGGELVQTVTAGGAAVAPITTRDGYTFSGWDKSFNNVNSNLTVTAKWSFVCGNSLVVNGVELSYEIVNGVVVIKPTQAQMAAILAYSGKENVFDLRGIGYTSVDMHAAAAWFKDVDETITIITDKGSASVKTKSLWNNSGKERLITVRDGKIDFKNK